MLLAATVGIGLGVKHWQGVAAPDVPLNCASAIVIDYETGLTLLDKKADVARPPASTTKIVTALVLLDKAKMEDVVVAPKDIKNVKESSLYLQPGERISMEGMLYAILLRSANDACVASAVHVAGTVPAFAQLMNQKAKELGATHTNFTNPHGLPDPKHVTSARDLAFFGRAAMENPDFARIVATPSYAIQRSINTKFVEFDNRNKLLFEDPTVDGIKTGYTRAAGLCFVGTAMRNGRRLVTVVLNSKDSWRDDTKILMDWAFANVQPNGVLSKNEVIESRDLEGATVPLVSIATEDVVGVPGQRIFRRVEIQKDIPLPIKAGTKVGTITIGDGARFRKVVDLVARDEVLQKPRTAGLAGTIALGAGFAGGLLFMRARRNRVYAQVAHAESH